MGFFHGQATCKEYFDNFEAARSEERAARDLFKAKRQEMDTLQLMINKVKNAMSVEDMDSKVSDLIVYPSTLLIAALDLYSIFEYVCKY